MRVLANRWLRIACIVIGTTVASQALSTSVLAQVEQMLPETTLKYRVGNVDGVDTEITPEVVQENAKMGRLKRPRRQDRVYSLKSFHAYLEKKKEDSEAGIYIGVVVRDESSLEHYEGVHKHVVELMQGYHTYDASTGKPGALVAGFSERFGAEVAGIFAVRFQPDADFYLEDTSVRIAVPLHSILVRVNGGLYSAVRAGATLSADYEYQMPTTLADMEGNLALYLSKDDHRYSYKESRAHEEAIEAAARARYGDDAMPPASFIRYQADSR